MLQSVTFGAPVVNKQNCTRLAEEHSNWSYFSLFMSVTQVLGYSAGVPTRASLNSLNIHTYHRCTVVI